MPACGGHFASNCDYRIRQAQEVVSQCDKIETGKGPYY